MDWKFTFALCFFRGVVYVSSVISPADVLILLDSSDSFRSNNFEFEERFAVQFVRYLYSRENRIGLFTFGDNTHSQFLLNTYNDEQQIVQAIKYMWYSTGDGAVEKAINSTLAKAFQEANGDRECVPNIFVILTHSAIKEQSTANELRDTLNKNSIQTFILNMAGLSASANFAVLTNASSRVINIDDFNALETSVTGLAQQISSDLTSTGCGKLTQWQPWTKCSASCGPGLRFRLRECQKAKATDKDCAAELSEDSICSTQVCTDPVNGQWANWNSWSSCSKSCESGIQTRTRACDAPRPMHGGKLCPGSSKQQRNCSEWNCPDCGKSCPAGGLLSQDCKTCICSSVILYGQITDESGLPVEKADVFLESRRYKAIAHTGEMGDFSVGGICLMNEKVFVAANLHESKLQSPLQVNSTHWTINGTIEKYLPAVFTVQPHDKARMTGQSFSLCCSAVGKPSPEIYSWRKNGIELEDMGTNGTLTFSAALKSHAGTYICVTETLAGVSQSDEAHVTISDFADDTCDAPVSKLEQLPAGCFLTGDTAKKASIDVGTCGRTQCMTSSLKDNGTCTDWWPHYCCDAKDVEELDISCDGFSYKTTRVKSCQCKLCIYRTIVAGRAIGRNNSKDIPFQLGSIYVNGKELGRTNMAGFFKFTVPKGSKRIVATFHDTIFKKFMDITKIFNVEDGQEIHATVVIPLKPKPISFNTSHSTEIELGGGNDGLRAVASIAIQKDSFVGSDGQTYKGAAKATVHFMDPRDRDSLDAANGEFESETPDGAKTPLRTYGMFQLGVDDPNGNPLQIQKSVKFYLDSSLFNITLDNNGEPDLALWDYDVNKGVWVENAKLRFAKSQNGRRKLLDTNDRLEANFRPVNIPPMTENVVTYHTERIWTGRYTNCDHSVKIYDNVPVKEVKLKQGVCFVAVSVFSDMTLTEPLSTSDGGVTITAYTQEMHGILKPYLGKREERTLKNGRTCVMAFCDQHVYINVESAWGEKLMVANHTLPPYYPVIPTNKTHEVKFESRDFGNDYNGPMFQYPNLATCRVATNSNSFHFNFAHFTKPSQMSYVTGSENIYDKKMSWYPVSPEKATFRSCFIKVLLKVYDTYDIRIIATSYLSNFGGEQFGTHIVGPTPNPQSLDFSVRGACIEFRCPGYIKDESREIFDQPTALEMQLSTKNASIQCTLSVPNAGLQSDISPITNGTKGVTGARFLSKAGFNYGSSYGVFINDAHKNDVEKFCKSGHDSGPSVDGIMDPLRNPAVEFDCLN